MRTFLLPDGALISLEKICFVGPALENKSKYVEIESLEDKFKLYKFVIAFSGFGLPLEVFNQSFKELDATRCELILAMKRAEP